MSVTCDYCANIIHGKEADVTDPLVVLYGLLQDDNYEHLCNECSSKIKMLMLSTEPRPIAAQDVLQVMGNTDWRIKTSSDQLLLLNSDWLTVPMAISDMIKVLRAEVTDVKAEGNSVTITVKSTGLKRKGNHND